jgi:uridine kinase
VGHRNLPAEWTFDQGSPAGERAAALPLKATRRVDLVRDFTEETAAAFRRHRYRFEEVDVAIVEGIYLFKRAYRPPFDLALWVECSFETALRRAIARAQEGLPPAETIRA